MSKIVNGSSLQPLSGGRPKQIVLLLHGYGSNGADLIALAPHWQRGLPDALFLAPNAPHGPFHDVPSALYAKYKAKDLAPVLLGNTKDADDVARIFAEGSMQMAWRCGGL